jgi:hypothetical protein
MGGTGFAVSTWGWPLRSSVMAAPSSGRASNTVLPDLWRRLTALPPNKAFPLWAGPLEITCDGASVSGRGQAQFVFRPSPRVRCELASRADSAQIAALLIRPVTPVFPDFGDRPPIPGRGACGAVLR